MTRARARPATTASIAIRVNTTAWDTPGITGQVSPENKEEADSLAEKFEAHHHLDQVTACNQGKRARLRRATLPRSGSRFPRPASWRHPPGLFSAQQQEYRQDTCKNDHTLQERLIGAVFPEDGTCPWGDRSITAGHGRVSGRTSARNMDQEDGSQD